VTISEVTEKNKPQLLFDGEELKTVVITSEKFEGLQVKMTFVQKNGRTSLGPFQWIGDYVPTDDPDWIPRRLLGPAINQARAIFSDYRRGKRHHKQKPQTSQARLIP